MEKKYDLLLKGGNLLLSCGAMGIRDLAVRKGRVAAVGTGLPEEDAETVLDARGCLITPGFVNLRLAPDLSGTAGEEEASSPVAAREKISGRETWPRGVPEQERAAYGETLLRAEKMLEKCLRLGTTAVRVEVRVCPQEGNTTWELVLELQRRFRGRIDILTMVPWDAFENPQYGPKLRAAAAAGQIDAIGGTVSAGTEDIATVDAALRCAGKLGLPLDLCCGCSDLPEVEGLTHLARRVLEQRLQGRVTCTGMNALAAKGLPEGTAADVIAWMAKAHVNVTATPSCDLWLMDGSRRGMTRIRQLMECGVNVSIASGHIRDAYCPFGNGDLLEEALLAAKLARFGTGKRLQRTLEMITYNAAAAALLPHYGVLPGSRADLVVLEAADPAQAVLDNAARRYVIKDGRIAAAMPERRSS